MLAIFMTLGVLFNSHIEQRGSYREQSIVSVCSLPLELEHQMNLGQFLLF